MDLGFAVPTNLTPVLLEFKRNNVVQVSAPASPEDAPQAVPFGAPAPQPQAAPQPEPPAGASRRPPAGEPSSPDRQNRERGLSDISRSVIGDVGEEN